MVSREDILRQVKSELRESYSTEDFLMHASSAVDTMDAVLNGMFESVRNWYQIYLPELPDVEDRKLYLEVIEKYVKEQPGSEKALSEKAAKLLPKGESMGARISREDLSVLQEYARRLRGMYEVRDLLSEYIERTVEKVAPNLSYLVGNMLATKLIVSAKGIRRLANMPASGIQVMGAEKALFMHLIKHTKPPKHGIIFLHPAMRGIKKKDRGRVARLISAKISIAAKADAYTHNFIAPKLKEDLDKKIASIIQKSGEATPEDIEKERLEKEERFRQRIAEGKSRFGEQKGQREGKLRKWEGAGRIAGEEKHKESFGKKEHSERSYSEKGNIRPYGSEGRERRARSVYSRDREERGGRQFGGGSEGGRFERRVRRDVEMFERGDRENRGERGFGRGGKFRGRKKKGRF